MFYHRNALMEEFGDGELHQHSSVADMNGCENEFYEAYEQHMQAKAEYEAEMRNERYFEERGAYEPEDPREIEAQMRDDELREASRLRAIHDEVGLPHPSAPGATHTTLARLEGRL